MMAFDPKDGVYILGTRFAIQRRENKQSKKIEWLLLEANKHQNCYELVTVHSDAISLTMDLVAHHIMRVKGKGIKTLDVYRETVDVISRRCETAISILDPKTLGGIIL